MKFVKKLTKVITLAALTAAMLATFLGLGPRVTFAGDLYPSSSPDGSISTNSSIKGVKWTGASIAVFGGWGTSTNDISVGVNGDDYASLNGLGSDGWVLGGELAYDVRLPSNIVAGVYGGLDFSDIETKASFDGESAHFDRGDSYYAGARLGLLVGKDHDSLLYAKVQYVWNTPGDLVVPGETIKLDDREGWGFGGGIETQLKDSSGLFAFADYTHIVYDSNCVYCKDDIKDRTDISVREETTDNIFKVGLKYRK